MHKLLLAGVAVLAVSTAAHASIIPTLTSVTANGDGTYTYDYSGYLAGDQGVTNGSELVIYDFAGYVPNSISASGNPDITVSTQNVGPALLMPPGSSDNASLVNLVYTYTGPNYDTSGGPFGVTNFNGLTAESTLSGTAQGVFSAMAIKNTGSLTGTTTYNTGYVEVPGGVPEPATWALMILGVGMAGSALRRQNRGVKASV
ncbi:MAG TPA: PEPxxWA-CTERM sorting domain-containing protein [Caulobacteraceae bacterium]|jgi:hypothetical protein|nr:PEPxxWA-CTERM sorting domain-containing protein [Caulobacteraceae bacterium]